MGVKGGARVVVVGSGAREHALVRALADAGAEPTVFAYPGNPGILDTAALLPAASPDVRDVVRAAHEHGIDLLVVGPEVPLSHGIADLAARAGIRVFGPTRAAARIETSKAWAKSLMLANQVPTAEHARFTTAAQARRYILGRGAPVVVKADGLAAGKGVLVTRDLEQAVQFAEDCLDHGPVVVEEFLEGPELSLFALVSGHQVVPFGAARDHKRAYDEDMGPNTGGMGAVSPLPGIDGPALERLCDQTIVPVARALADAGTPYTGVIFAGIVMTRNGPMVLEYNARFGDPEAQALLPRLGTDLLELLSATADGKLESCSVGWRDVAACAVTVASREYPDAAPTPQPVTLGSTPDGSILFHAGTTRAEDGSVLATGGRVFSAVGLGTTLNEARERAYALAAQVRFDGAWYRRDIGARDT